MDILWNTFGLIGLASCLAWATAAGLLVAGILPRLRMRAWVLAAGLAAVGVVLAILTGEYIRSIEIDRSAEVLAAEAAGAKAAREKLRDRAAGIRFAEDTAADQADVAGVSVAEEQGAYERAVEEQMAKIPAYRSRGRQERRTAAGAAAAPAAGGGDGNGAQEGGQDRGASSEGDRPQARALPEAHLVVADRFDRINRAVAWTALALALGLVSVEYVRLFNSTFDAVWPLPLAGTAIDGAFAKSHVVDATRDQRAWLAGFLQQAVRKGESFVLFADADPWPGRERLDRLSCGPLRWSIPKRTFSSAELQADPALGEIVFETAWFGRGVFVLTGEPGAADVLAGFLAAMERRHACRAVAARTVNLAWALESPPEASHRDTIDHLAAGMNVRAVVWR